MDTKRTALALPLLLAAAAASGAAVVTVRLPNDGKTDVADGLQKLIDENPNRTIYFPDGTYLLGKPVLTPADPKRSVDLWLSNYAILRAAPGWSSSEAMVRLGASHPANDILTPGSVYSLTGGIIDGNGVADGISIDGGRETRVRLVSVKGTCVGLRIKRGANHGSSDADVADVNIVGNGATNSVGVWITGYDNTLTGLRIARVNTGVVIEGGGNVLRNVHPLYTCGDAAYDASCGFDDRGGNNFYDFCYSDHFSTGFRISPKTTGVFDKCFVFWYAPSRGRRHTAFRADGAFRSLVRGLTVGFNGREAVNTVLEVGADGGNGVIENLRMNPALVNETERAYERHLRGSVLSL